MTDEQLIKACKRQDPKAQEQLYRRYAGRLMGICLRYGKSREEAEDIFQEAFIKVFQHISNLKEDLALDAWVKKIVVHTAINHYHKNKKHFDTVDGDMIQENNENEDYQKIMDQLSNEELLKLINQLPPGYRMVFNLYIIEGYTHPEIAEMLNTSVSNSKNQLMKAKNTLKRKLEELNLVKL